MLIQEISLKVLTILMYPELMTSNGKYNSRVNLILAEMITYSRLQMPVLLMVMNILVMEEDLLLLH
jgi:hypothetical protein